MVPNVDGYQIQNKLGVRKRILDFQFTSDFLPFLDLENVLVCWFFFKVTLYKCFFWKSILKVWISGGIGLIFSIYFVCVYATYMYHRKFSDTFLWVSKFYAKLICLMVRTDGQTDENQKSPLIFFILCVFIDKVFASLYMW